MLLPSAREDVDSFVTPAARSPGAPRIDDPSCAPPAPDSEMRGRRFTRERVREPPALDIGRRTGATTAERWRTQTERRLLVRSNAKNKGDDPSTAALERSAKASRSF